MTETYLRPEDFQTQPPIDFNDSTPKAIRAKGKAVKVIETESEDGTEDDEFQTPRALKRGPVILSSDGSDSMEIAEMQSDQEASEKESESIAENETQSDSQNFKTIDLTKVNKNAMKAGKDKRAFRKRVKEERALVVDNKVC